MKIKLVERTMRLSLAEKWVAILEDEIVTTARGLYGDFGICGTALE